MTDALDSIFDGILAGDDGLLEGFGISRMTTTGPRMPAGISKWEDSLEIAGDGRVRFTLRRSFSDMPGRAPGVYEMQKGKALVLKLVRLLKACRTSERVHSRVTLQDVTIRVAVATGGFAEEYIFSAADQETVARWKPLLSEFGALAGEAEQSPLMNLGLTVARPARSSVGEAVPLRLSVTFQNSGTVGYWLTHPSRFVEGTDFCELQYGRKPEVRQDVMPEPLVVQRAALTVAQEGAGDLVWMAPGQAALGGGGVFWGFRGGCDVRRVLPLFFLTAAVLAAREFRLDYAQVAGVGLADHHLSIEGTRATWVHEPRRAVVERGLIGVFRTEVSEAEQDRLIRDFPARSTQGIRPDMPAVSVRLRVDGRETAVALAPGDAAGGLFLADVRAIVERALAHPFRALRIDLVLPVETRLDGEQRVRVRIENAGVEALSLRLDERVVSLEDSVARPVVWGQVSVRPWRREVRIAAGAVAELEIGGVRFSVGRVLVRALFCGSKEGDFVGCASSAWVGWR